MDAATELRRAIRAYLENPPHGAPDLAGPLHSLDAAIASTTTAPAPPKSLVGRGQPNTGSRLSVAAGKYRDQVPESQKAILIAPLDAILTGLSNSPAQQQQREITEPPSHSGQLPEPDQEWAGHDPAPVVRQ